MVQLMEKIAHLKPLDLPTLTRSNPVCDVGAPIEGMIKNSTWIGCAGIKKNHKSLHAEKSFQDAWPNPTKGPFEYFCDATNAPKYRACPRAEACGRRRSEILPQSGSRLSEPKPNWGYFKCDHWRIPICISIPHQTFPKCHKDHRNEGPKSCPAPDHERKRPHICGHRTQEIFIFVALQIFSPQHDMQPACNNRDHMRYFGLKFPQPTPPIVFWRPLNQARTKDKVRRQSQEIKTVCHRVSNFSSDDQPCEWAPLANSIGCRFQRKGWCMVP